MSAAAQQGASERVAAAAQATGERAAPGPRFPFPIPTGWFAVAFSDELPAGTVRAVRAFGRELVAWRGTDGVPHVFDAYCPHLGAHLGVGGRVEPGGLRCPFHAWLWDGAGRCVEVPYARKIPPKARIRAWPVCERANLLLVWHDASGALPWFEVPEVPELAGGAWTAPERREWIVRTCPQEMAENTVDEAHFRYVHGTHAVAKTESVTAEGAVFRVVSRNRVGTPRGEQTGRIEIETHGLGFGTTRFSGIADLLLVTAGLPVDAETMHMRLQFSVRRLPDSDATRGVGRAFLAEIERQFTQDVPIWEHKVYLPRPILCDGDGPIATLRRWARRFY
ncbi:MAG TPA: Rieske 2Fe-2S domain-containing protein [Myxococcota bacterium]